MTKQRGILRASVVSAIGTALSRVLGAARDIALSHVFGAGRISDVFWVAWTVPSVFRRFVADEGLTGALIPAIAQAERNQGEDAAKRLAGGASIALVIACAVIVVGGIVLAPWLVHAFAFGFADDPEKWELTITLTRWMFPFIGFVSLVSFCEALLNYRGHFFIPKIAPGIVSGSIAAAALWATDLFPHPTYALAAGVLIGGMLHLLVCVPPLVRQWGWPPPSFAAMKTPAFRQFAREMGKVIAIGLLAQLNVVVLRLLGTLLPEGSVTQYWYANRVVDLAQGAIAVAVGSALLPVIARNAADGDWDKLRNHFAEAVMLAAVVLVPTAALLLGMAEPIVAILFRHGEFDVEAARHTVATLRALVPFMLALAGINLVKKIYFALDERTTLLFVGVGGLAATVALGFTLSRQFGVLGLGLALSISATLQLVAYLLLLRRRAGLQLGGRDLGSSLGRLVLAATPAGLASAGLAFLGDWSRGPSDPRNLLVLVAGGATGGALYVGLALALKVEEVRALVARIRRKRRATPE